jgi:hypothetical protein
MSRRLTRDPADVLRCAQALARNCGFHVFPVLLLIQPNGKADKEPLVKWKEGASTDPIAVERMWRDHPGDLIGVATGAASDLDVVDLDKRHSTAIAWWRVNHDRLPATRTFGTYSGGLHLHYRHRAGLRNTGSKICEGVDSRGEGGFAVHWGAYGCEAVDHTPPQAMPDWLYDELTYVPPRPTRTQRAAYDPDRAVDGLLRKLSEARQGNRNGMLFWCACRLMADHEFGPGAALGILLPIALDIGLPEPEARKTIASAENREPRGNYGGRRAA